MHSGGEIDDQQGGGDDDVVMQTSRNSSDDDDDDDMQPAQDAPVHVSPTGAPIRVRTVAGREATVLKDRGKGWLYVELDGNENDEGGAHERKSIRRPHGFAPGQDHLLDAVPKPPKPEKYTMPSDLAEKIRENTPKSIASFLAGRQADCRGRGADFSRQRPDHL